MRVLRVLLVDDNPTFLKALENLLASDAGIDVIASTQFGQEAIELAAQLRPDLVLVDLHMSGTDGLATTSQIKRGKEAPFVFVMSLHDEIGFREAALAHGADAFLSKSDLPTHLLPLIRRLCGKLD